MFEERVDILMATYNGENYFKEQIESILKQSYQNFHILISDDRSTDGTQKLIDDYVNKYPDKIFQFFPEEKKGAKGNFSFLMQHAKAPYIMLSDQDDIWLEDKIKKTLFKMKELEASHGKNEPLLVHTDLQVVDQHLNVLGTSFWTYTKLPAPTFSRLNHFLMQNAVTGCTLMMNKPLSDLSYPVAPASLMHDWWIALVASAFGKIGILNEQTILYRQHSNNTLGAQKFGTFRYLLNLIKKMSKGGKSFEQASLNRLAQAEAFSKRYLSLLKPSQKQVLEDYLSLKNISFFKRCQVVKKHRFYRSGILRNCLIFMKRWQP